MSATFEEIFPLLPRNYQQIWKILHWFANKYKCVFPSHKKIAELVQCSPRTVIRAIKKFLQYEWLGYQKRCYRSNVYFVSSELLKKNPKDPKLFQNVTQSVTLYSVSLSKATARSNVHQTIPSKEPFRPKIRHQLQNLPFPLQNKIDIQRNFSERVIDLALESYKSYKFAIQNPLGFFYRLCGIENKRMKLRKK